VRKRMECPKCKDEMIKGWTVEFDYYLGLSSDDDRWEDIKNNVKKEFWACFECNLRVYNEEHK